MTSAWIVPMDECARFPTPMFFVDTGVNVVSCPDFQIVLEKPPLGWPSGLCAQRRPPVEQAVADHSAPRGETSLAPGPAIYDAQVVHDTLKRDDALAQERIVGEEVFR